MEIVVIHFQGKRSVWMISSHWVEELETVR